MKALINIDEFDARARIYYNCIFSSQTLRWRRLFKMVFFPFAFLF